MIDQANCYADLDRMNLNALRADALQFVTARYGFTLDQLLTTERTARVVEARALLVWILRTFEPDHGHSAIGRWIGRCPSVVFGYMQKALRLREMDRAFAELTEDFTAMQRRKGNLHACA